MRKANRLIGAGLIGLAGALSGCGERTETVDTGLEEKIVENAQPTGLEISEANQFLRAFPDEIPGIESVEKYETPGADQTIVHIRQRHYFNPDNLHIHRVINEEIESLRESIKEFEEDFPEEASEMRRAINRSIEIGRLGVREYFTEVINVQKNIFQSLIYLQKEIGLGETRVEGVHRDYEEEKLMDHINLIYAEVINKGYFTKEEAEEKEVVFLGGAAHMLWSRGMIDIKPAETKEANLKALEVFLDSNSSASEREKYSKKIREDVFLDLVDAGGERYSVVVYGALHDWRDNINEWNRDNPDNKFSLITMTPYGIEGDK
ncbi:MAG: hypothetical protein IIA87_04635 [Nanoarchaeota archaeon]|nr:hypothetical protein [Nanoarchaeota archaeon]